MEASNQNDSGTTGDVKESVGNAAADAGEKVSEAAGQAAEQARGVAEQARDRAREQMDQRSTEAGEKVGSTGSDLRAVGDELRNQGKDGAARITEQVAERFESAGDYLQRSDADSLLADVEEFGRRRPWAVLAGGVVAGVVAARFLKASSRERYTSRSQGTTGTRTAIGTEEADRQFEGVGIDQPEPAGVR